MFNAHPEYCLYLLPYRSCSKPLSSLNSSHVQISRILIWFLVCTTCASQIHLPIRTPFCHHLSFRPYLFIYVSTCLVLKNNGPITTATTTTTTPFHSVLVSSQSVSQCLKNLCCISPSALLSVRAAFIISSVCSSVLHLPIFAFIQVWL